jgi:hypothetical protein
MLPLELRMNRFAQEIQRDVRLHNNLLIIHLFPLLRLRAYL